MRVDRAFLAASLALVVAGGLVACSDGEPRRPAAATRYKPANLTEAVLLDDRTAVENFLALGADPNEAEPDGTTPLMRAVHGGFHEIADELIAAGASVSATNHYGVSALYLAARGGDVVATKTLLAARADANTALPSGETALMTAAKNGNAATVRALLTGGADDISLVQLARERVTASVAEASGYSTPFNPTAPRNYADVNARERWYGRTALMLAAAEGHADVVQLLIEAGSDIEATDEEGSTALWLARSAGHLDVAAMLAAAGAADTPSGG
jgi:ankyrin repeat protein